MPTILLFLFLYPLLLAAETLHVDIQNIQTHEGSLRVALYTPKNDFGSQNGYFQAKRITLQYSTSISTQFDDLPAGRYALAIFQDLNENGTLDDNFLGIPTEPYGFSNNVQPQWGQPDFEPCAFDFPWVHHVTIDLIH